MSLTGAEDFIRQYGYAAVVLGTFVEGETALLLAGLLAHMGYLDLSGVIIAGFLGAAAFDNAAFLVGRRGGREFLQRRPSLQAKAAPVERLVRDHGRLAAFGMHFLYGLRAVTALLLGASGVRLARFTPYNALGVALWSILVGWLGYVAGQALAVLIDEYGQYELPIVLVILTAGSLTGWLVYRRRHNRRPR